MQDSKLAKVNGHVVLFRGTGSNLASQLKQEAHTSSYTADAESQAYLHLTSPNEFFPDACAQKQNRACDLVPLTANVHNASHEKAY